MKTTCWLKYFCALLLIYSLRSFSSVVMASSHCPPGFIRNLTVSESTEQSSCVCGKYLHGIVKCDEENSVAQLANGYCMTFDTSSNATLVGKCPYRNYTFTKHGEQVAYLPLPESVFELEEYLCGGFHRHGILCSHCSESYGPSVTSYSMYCTPCENNFQYYGRGVYVLLQFVPVTFLYIIIMIFNIKLTKSPVSMFILYCQVLVNMVNYDTNLYTHLLLATEGNDFLYYSLKFVLSFYGFWNLDVFPSILPPFCIDTSLKGRHLFLLQYIVALYPLVLIALIYFCVHLYTRNVKIIVIPWKAIKGCLNRLCCCGCQRIMQRISSESIANSFSSFLVLAYSKILFVSLSFLLPIQLYDSNGGMTPDSPVLYYDPHIQFFGSKHLPYGLISVFIILVFTILPLLLLVLHPMFSCPASCNSHSIRFFVERFQGWFKDGTEPGTRDFRMVAALHPLLRIVFALSVFLVTVIVVPSSPYSSATWLVPGLVFTGASLFFALAKTYKLQYMNTLESLQFALLGLISFLVSYHVGIYVAFVLGAIPMVTVLGYAIYKLLKCTKCLKRCTSAYKRNMWSIPLSNPDENTNLITEPFSADRLENPDRYSDPKVNSMENSNITSAIDVPVEIEVTPVYTYGTIGKN